MAEIASNPPQLSVHILLPEALDRRLERRTKRTPGASWPSWGGHITLVPNFVPRASLEEVRAILTMACADEAPFVVRFAAPIAVQDSTRPDYFAVFLTVESMETVDIVDEAQVNGQHSPLHALRNKFLATLEAVREDLRPQLSELPFLPHVTLALGIAESEARKLVQAIRAEPIVAEFKVEVVWMLAQYVEGEARFERYPIPLGRVAPVELLRD